MKGESRLVTGSCGFVFVCFAFFVVRFFCGCVDTEFLWFVSVVVYRVPILFTLFILYFGCVFCHNFYVSTL